MISVKRLVLASMKYNLLILQSTFEFGQYSSLFTFTCQKRFSVVSLDREDESTALQAIICSYPKHSSYVDLDSFGPKHKIFCMHALNCF